MGILIRLDYIFFTKLKTTMFYMERNLNLFKSLLVCGCSDTVKYVLQMMALYMDVLLASGGNDCNDARPTPPI